MEIMMVEIALRSWDATTIEFFLESPFNANFQKVIRLIARSALYVRRQVKIRCKMRLVCLFDLVIQTAKVPQRGGHVLLSSETFKHRFRRTWKKLKTFWYVVDNGHFRINFGSTFLHFFDLLKNKILTWIASVDKKVEESRRLGVVVSGKFA